MDPNENQFFSQNPNSNNTPNYQNHPYGFYPPNFPNYQNHPYSLYPQNFSPFPPSQSSQNLPNFPPYPYFSPPNFHNQNCENISYPYCPPNLPTSPPLDVASRTSNTSDPCSFSDSQNPSISVPPQMENINLNAPRNVDVVEKRQAWTPEDDRMLVKAWITISSDSVVGNDQNLKAFWRRIANYFNKHRKSGPERTRTSVKQHWYWLLPQVNEFNQLYNRLLGEHRSGWSDDQIKQHARELYYQSRGKHFTHEHVWVMVKDDPKWQPVIPISRSTKRTKNTESGAYTSSSNANTSEDVEVDEVEVRPIGQKAAKDKAKRKGKAKDMGDTSANVRAEMWDTWNTKIDNKNKIGENLTELAAFDLLLRDVSSMNPEQLADHKKICDIIRKKYGF